MNLHKQTILIRQNAAEVNTYVGVHHLLFRRVKMHVHEPVNSLIDDIQRQVSNEINFVLTGKEWWA